MFSTLWSMVAGDSCYLSDFSPQIPPKHKIRLIELGFHPGRFISCLQSPSMKAPKVYCISNTIFSLDDEIADHIYIDRTHHQTGD